MSMRARPGERVMLACRNLWKVFGRVPGYYFDTAGYSIDPEALAARLRACAPLMPRWSFSVSEI